MSPPGTFSINSALAMPPKVMVGNHDHLAVARRNRKRHVHRIGLANTGIEADTEPPLRLRIGRVLRPVGEELAERALAAGNDEEVEPADQRRDIAFLDAAVFDPAAAIRKILHQHRQIDPVVDGAARPREVTAEADRLREIEKVIVVVIVLLRVVPVIDAEIVFARDRHMVVRDRVQETDAAILVRRAVGDQRGVDAVLLKIQGQMQAGDAGPDDPDAPSHVRLPERLFGSWPPVVGGSLAANLPEKNGMDRI